MTTRLITDDPLLLIPNRDKGKCWYSGSVIAMRRNNNGDVSAANLLENFLATSEQEALGHLYQLAMKQLPEKDGWHNHKFLTKEVGA